MPNFTFEGEAFELGAGETVLECLERHDIPLASSCRSGVCQSCLIRAVEGVPPAHAQKGLRETQRAQGYFLACSCVPLENLVVERGAGQERFCGVIEGIHPLGGGVVRLRMQPRNAFQYFPGQFLNLHLPSGQVRSYSIASTTEERFLELHMALIPGGCASEWLREQAAVGDEVHFTGPAGNCFYFAGQPGRPLLLAGTGTGLAPLYGIARDALRQGHTGPVHLFHGVLNGARSYLVDELRKLSEEHANFTYVPSVLEPPAPEGFFTGALGTLIQEALPSLKGWRVFLCGHPDLVRQLQKQCFLAGASMKDILADAFLPAAATSLAAAKT